MYTRQKSAEYATSKGRSTDTPTPLTERTAPYSRYYDKHEVTSATRGSTACRDNAGSLSPSDKAQLRISVAVLDVQEISSLEKATRSRQSRALQYRAVDAVSAIRLNKTVVHDANIPRGDI